MFRNTGTCHPFCPEMQALAFSMFIAASWAMPGAKPEAIVDVAIVGAGIAGLYAGWKLKLANFSFVILEADARAGGRVKVASRAA